MIQMDVEALRQIAFDEAEAQGVRVPQLVASIREHVAETDETGEIPDSFWSRLDVGAMNRVLVPLRFNGGAGVSAMSRVAVFEEVGFADPGYAIALPGPGLATPPVSALGSEEQQRRFFCSFLDGRPRWGAFAITEPEIGSDATSLRTTATRTERGYVLNGTKCFITNGARAHAVVVFATVDRARGRFGVRAFLVRADNPGFEVVGKERMLGCERASSRYCGSKTA